VTAPPRSTALRCACAAAFLSGGAALGFEILWVRRLGEFFGGGSVAVHVVLTVFFGGMGLGARLVGPWVDRRGATPRTWLLMEGWVAACGLAFFPCANLVEEAFVRWLPGEVSAGVALAAKVVAAVVLLLPPTIAMGATLPVLIRLLPKYPRGPGDARELGTRLAWLYGSNTLGGAVGVAAAVFLWIPHLGMRGAAAACVALNASAIAAVFLGRLPASRPSRPGASRAPMRTLFLVGAGLSGFCSVGMEVVWVRALAGRFANTVYSFAGILAVYLACLALGSLLLVGLERRGWTGALSSALAFVASGLAGLASAFFLASEGRTPLGGGLLAMQLHEWSVTGLVLFVPCLAFGLQLPLLTRLGSRGEDSLGRDLGSFLAVNTLGAIAAAPIVSSLGFPLLGLRSCLIVLSVASVSFGLFAILPERDADARTEGGLRTAVTWSSIVALALVASWLPDVRAWRENASDELAAYTEGRLASVAVVQAQTGERVLKLNNHYRLGSARTQFAQERQGLVPLLLHPAPRDVLFLGVGTGSSVGAAVALGDVAVDGVELVPEILPLLPWFDRINRGVAAAAQRRPDVRLLDADARHFVLASERLYDVVIGDLFVPWRAGEGAMYTREHLAAVSRRLRPGGLFCQWLPLYQLDRSALDSILATFARVFPRVDLFWLYFNAEQPVVGVVGTLDRTLELRTQPAKTVVGEAGLADLDELRGSWVLGFDALPDWLRSAPIESRDRPFIEFVSANQRAQRSETPAAENVRYLLERARPLSEAPWQLDEGEATRAESTRSAIDAFFRAALALQTGDEAGALGELSAALGARPDWDWMAANLESRLDRHAAAGAWSHFEQALEALARSAFPERLEYWRGVERWARYDDEAGARAAWERALLAAPDHLPSARQLQLLDAR